METNKVNDSKNASNHSGDVKTGKELDESKITPKSPSIAPAAASAPTNTEAKAPAEKTPTPIGQVKLA